MTAEGTLEGRRGVRCYDTVGQQVPPWHHSNKKGVSMMVSPDTGFEEGLAIPVSSRRSRVRGENSGWNQGATTEDPETQA